MQMRLIVMTRRGVLLAGRWADNITDEIVEGTKQALRETLGATGGAYISIETEEDIFVVFPRDAVESVSIEIVPDLGEG